MPVQRVIKHLSRLIITTCLYFCTFSLSLSLSVSLFLCASFCSHVNTICCFVGRPQLGSSGAVNDYACSGDSVTQWLSQPSVQKALHVTPGKSGMQYTWGPTEYSGDLRPVYKKLISK